MPNRNELESIVDDDKFSAPTIDTSYFPSATSVGYWSSTTNATSGNQANRVNFATGNVSGTNSKSILYKVRCVRTKYDEPHFTYSTPMDGDTGVLPDTNVAINFNTAMDLTTITIDTDTNCFGSIQMSEASTDFNNCIQMDSTIDVTNNGRTFTISPVVDLSGDTIYKIKITNGVLDSFGKSLSKEYITNTGFRTQ
ncbi:MAG: DUF1566 domain-containing protein [Proteobacteria bacterium]|nr:DUF1566 domain-containing protein [Pseudomonadota bacterium]